MNFFIKSLRSLDKFEIALWICSVAAVVLSFVLTASTDYMTLAASLVGATALIFVSKGNAIGQILMIVFAALYGAVSYSYKYYGEMFTYIGMSAPIATIAAVTWLKNSFNGSKTEVKINTVKRAEYALLAAIATAVTVAFYFILDALGTANIIASTVSVSTSFTAAYLTMRRCEYYAIAYALNDIVLIAMWIYACAENISYLSMVVCFTVFLINDIYGFINWRKTKRKQSEALRQQDAHDARHRDEL